jgi:hypothetical protein
MYRIIIALALLLTLGSGRVDSGLTKRAHPHVLNGFLLSGWCNDLPFRDEESQQRATYYQAYSDGMCTMFVAFGVELTRREGNLQAGYCLPGDVKYLSIAQEFGLLLRRDAGARETDPLDALIKLLESRFPCEAK